MKNTQLVMDNKKVINTNKKLETLLTKLGFEKSIETGGGGYSMWNYESYYNQSLRCRVEYNEFNNEGVITLPYAIFEDISSDIDDTGWSDVKGICNLKELEDCILNIKK
jgi:hypothetical protein